MANFLASSVKVLEEEPPIGTFPELPSAVPAFVGLTERGALDTPTEILSWDDYVEKFGGHKSGCYLSVAVRGFFMNNDGGKCVVVRRLEGSPVAATVTLQDRDATPADTLTVTASSVGEWGNGATGGLKVEIAAPTSGKETGASAEFNLYILKNDVIVESFPNVTMDDTAANYVETVVNHPDTGSIYVTVTDEDSATTPPDDRPAVATTALAAGSEGTAVTDTTFSQNNDATDPDFAVLEAEDITLIAVPDRATTAVQNSMTVFCTTIMNNGVFAVFDPPASSDSAAIRTHVGTLTVSEMWSLYWPRIRIPNPSKAVFGTSDLIVTPPSGFICGMMARNDSANLAGPFVQPAGVEEGQLRGVVDLETDKHPVLRESVRDVVYPDLINPIWYLRGYGIFVDGSRTGRSTGNFPSVGERRGVSHIEVLMKLGLQWVRHKNNTQTLRGRVDKTVVSEMLTWTENDALASKVPSQAFIVDADVPGIGINNARTRKQKKLYVRLGLATAKPAEYVIVLVSQDTRSIDEATLGLLS